MRGTYITAIVIALLISLWLFSGQIGQDDTVVHTTLAEANRQLDARAQDASPTRVRARVIHAEPQNRRVVLRGRTENKRTVDVKAETSGRITDRPVERGSRVRVGDLLCRINTEDRFAALEEARAALTQANIEHQASLRLQVSRASCPKLPSLRLPLAWLLPKRRWSAVNSTSSSPTFAPRSPASSRTYTSISATTPPRVPPAQRWWTCTPCCSSVVSPSAMSAVWTSAQTVMGTLSDGRRVEGPITFIGQQSDPATRTYPVEVQVPNADFALRSGITTEIRVPVDEVMAHKISPALFALADDGSIGVRTIDEEQPRRVSSGRHRPRRYRWRLGQRPAGGDHVDHRGTGARRARTAGRADLRARRRDAGQSAVRKGRAQQLRDPGSRPDSEAPLVSLAAKP
jgi:membrane fusion protein, multidrug efflux system